MRRAELEVKRNELLPQIDQRKNDLNLEESRRRLKQLESDIQSRREQAQAEIAVLAEKKRKGHAGTVARAAAPCSRLSCFLRWRAGRDPAEPAGNVFPRNADSRRSRRRSGAAGMPIADVLDLSELEVVAKIGELDRANLKEGQEVLISLDAVGEKTFHGKIKSMSGTASANIFSGDPAKKFDVVFSVDMKELLTGLGAKPEQISKIWLRPKRTAGKPPAQGIGGPMVSAGGGQMMAVSAPGAAAGGGGMAAAPAGGGAAAQAALRCGRSTGGRNGRTGGKVDRRDRGDRAAISLLKDQNENACRDGQSSQGPNDAGSFARGATRR